ncbi:hypothetical protein CYY_008478 [Polysphondylium violaceum]|uniref:MRH domain-containing protein n=1 Tax=Polysphondylium violaceum TaxID=133409 RepID=A0A8J4V177_9MYCE|nr:hypothetical protein CYY_008478 [Polysphondylium violaceum]
MKISLYIFPFLILFVYQVCGQACPTLTYTVQKKCPGNSSPYVVDTFVQIPTSQPQGATYSFSQELQPQIATYAVNKGPVYFLPHGGEYTLSWSFSNRPECANSTTIVPIITSFVVNHPKCRFSQGNFNFINPSSDFTYTQYPSYLYTQVAGLGCERNVVYYELSDAYPNLKIENTQCHKSTGSVQVLNDGAYSVMKLLLPDGAPIPTPSPGLWTQLSHHQQYTLALESDQCGDQFIPIDVFPNIPKFELVFHKNESCPTNSSVSVAFEDPTVFDLLDSITINGVAYTGEPYYFDFTSDINLALSLNGCSYARQMGKPYLIPDVHYTIEQCKNYNSTVNLIYDENVITDLQVSAGTNNSFSPVNVANKQFELNENQDQFYYSSQCYSSAIVQISSPVLPIVVIENPPQQAGDLFDIFVSNYMDFFELYLENTSLAYTKADQGWMRNIVATDTYNLKYRVDGCARYSLPISYFSGYLDSSFQDIITVISPGTCNRRGLVSFKSYYGIYPSEETISLFAPGELHTLTTTFPQQFPWGSSRSKLWTAPPDPWSFEQPNFNITVSKNCSCKYSNDGEIKITYMSDFVILAIEIDGIGYYPAGDGYSYIFSGLPCGELRVEVFEDLCSYRYYMIQMYSNSDFEIEYTTFPADPGEYNGGLKFNASQFSTLVGPNGVLLQYSGEFFNQQQNIYKFIFVTADLSCSGSFYALIPTTVPATVEVIPYTRPFCKKSLSGAFGVSLFDDNSVPIPISSIVNMKNGKIVNIATPPVVPAREYNYAIRSPSVVRLLNYDLIEQDIEFSYNILSEMGSPNSCQVWVFVELIPSVDNFVVDGVFANHYPLSKATNLFKYESRGESSFTVEIYYGTGCSKSLVIERNLQDKYILKNDWPNLSVTQNNCSDPDSINNIVEVHKGSGRVQSSLSTMSADLNGKFVQTSLGGSSADEITFRDPYSFCTITKTIPQTYSTSTVTVKKGICPTSNDGTIDLPIDTNTQQALVKEVISEQTSTLPVASSTSLNVFTGVRNSTFTILKTFKTNSFCSILESVQVTVDEPRVESVASVGACHIDEISLVNGGQIINTLSINTSSVTYSAGGISSIDDPVIKGLASGEYSSTVTINNKICKRVLLSNTVTVAQLPTVSTTIDVSQCAKATITPNQMQIQHKYIIKDSSNQTVNERNGIIGSFSVDFTKAGTYSLESSDMADTCSFKASFQVTACPINPTTTPHPSSSHESSQSHSPSHSESKSDNPENIQSKDDGGVNLGLAIGLPIGLVGGAAAAAAAGFFLYKKKFSASNKSVGTKMRGLPQ